jgi:hypothetical protein
MCIFELPPSQRSRRFVLIKEESVILPWMCIFQNCPLFSLSSRITLFTLGRSSNDIAPPAVLKNCIRMQTVIEQHLYSGVECSSLKSTAVDRRMTYLSSRIVQFTILSHLRGSFGSICLRDVCTVHFTITFAWLHWNPRSHSSVVRYYTMWDEEELKRVMQERKNVAENRANLLQCVTTTGTNHIDSPSSV